MTDQPTRVKLTEDATEKRARLFRFIEAGADESDFPSFAAALDEYVNAVTAIDTHVMEKADQECNEHLAAGREFRKLAERTQVWGQQHYDRANRYRARLDRVKTECDALMREVSGLNVYALAGRRDAVSRIQEATRPIEEPEKPPLPDQMFDPWPRIPIDTSEGSDFHHLNRTAGNAATGWALSSEGAYAQNLTLAEVVDGAVREALLHLLELALIDIDSARLNAAPGLPTHRERTSS